MLQDILLTLPSTYAFLAYLVLGLAAMVEGPLSLLAGGAAASSGLLLPVPVFIAVVMGNLTADMGWYALGRFGRVEWLEKACSHFGVDLNRIRRIQAGIQHYAPRLIFFSKLTVGLPIPTLVATGLSRVPPRRWIGMLVLGEMIKSAVFVTAGFFYARMIGQASAVLQAVLWSMTALIAVASLVWYRRHQSRLLTRKANLYD